MKVTLIAINDEHFSYRLNKHPDNKYEKNLGDNSVVRGYFPFYASDVSAYEIVVDHNIELILKHCRQTNKASYNDAVYWLAGPYNLKGFNEVFRSALRGRNELSPAVNAESHHYVMSIGPVSHYDEEKIKKITSGMGLTIFKNNAQVNSDVCELQIYGNMNLTEFLQKIYIFLYAYQYEYSLSIDTNDKLQQLKSFFTDWIEQVENKEYLFELLSGKRLYKLSKLDEEYGKQRVETVENKVNQSLHRKRHEIIGEIVNTFSPQIVVDAGCGSGQLVDYLPEEIDYLGFDAELRKSKLRRRKNTKYYETNVLFPYLDYNRDNSLMVLSEVVEHLDERERLILYRNINLFFQPDVVVITTPNYEYNVNYGLTGYRHPDHKIEFTSDTINEVIVGLYDYTFVGFEKVTDEVVQPSFIMVFKRSKPKNSAHIEAYKRTLKYEDGLKYNRAFCNHHFVENWQNLFYLGPTIAPAPSNETELESLDEAIKYYHDKGVTDLVFQVKEMGSRAYILWFEEMEYAQMYGFDRKLIINSRNGYPFFDESFTQQLWEELTENICPGTGMVMLDCEITPWNYKAKGLIEREFSTPLYAELLHLKGGKERTEEEKRRLNNVEKAINSLEMFSQDEELKINIFDVLVYNTPKFDKPIQETLSIFWFPTKHFRMVDTTKDVNLYCKLTKNKEGVVVKPNVRQVGVLPAMKVRNPDFLRLIYGAHYEDYYNLLTDRPLSTKRKHSHQQYAASVRMIQDFCDFKRVDVFSTASFINEEKVTDATL
jgi:SAM-dependent methyltransferase